MLLRQTLEHAVNGYWDGGAKQVFDWTIDGHIGQDNKGQYVRIGSWSANHWFYVAVGKTEKLTLSYAKQHLKAITSVSCTFEYINVNSTHLSNTFDNNRTRFMPSCLTTRKHYTCK